MLTEICQELRNWFDYGLPKWFGDFKIVNGQLQDVDLVSGQYFRIIGSLFNDGVHVYSGEDLLKDEDFHGSIWSMAVPPSVIDLMGEIEEWIKKYSDIMYSPFSSESFGGYTYSKAQGYANSGGGMLSSWQAVFANRLNKWRKI